MCRVDDFEALEDAIERTRVRAGIVTGMRDVYLEAVVEAQRQVGTIVVADRHGCCVELGHTDSSLELDYSCWVEELGPWVAPDLASAVGEAAVHLARALGWVGVGKVRWAVTPGRGWYLLGFSARLTTGFDLAEQVHGIDLINTQFSALVGDSLDWNQEDAIPRSHGLQIRILHVDPSTGARPAGVLERLELPEGVHATTGLDVGTVATEHTDPLLAKLTVIGPTREAAVARAATALDAVIVEGLETNLGVLRAVFRNPAFVRGDYDVSTLWGLARG